MHLILPLLRSPQVLEKSLCMVFDLIWRKYYPRNSIPTMMPHKLFFHELPAPSLSLSSATYASNLSVFPFLPRLTGRGEQKLRGGAVVLGHVAGREGDRDRQGANNLRLLFEIFSTSNYRLRENNVCKLRLFALNNPSDNLSFLKVLDDCADDLRNAVEIVSGLGELPKITFERGE